MFVYALLGIALLVGVWLVLQGAQKTPPHVLANILRWTGAIVGGALVLFLALRGWLWPALMLGLPALALILRGRAIANRLHAARGPTPGQSTTTETTLLAMELDHETGDLDGTVRAGPLEGQRLSTLSLDELRDLMAQCLADDPDGAQVLEAYLDRHHAGWRESEPDSPPSGNGAMTDAEALAILGLEPGADAAAIRDAHRRLMKQNHPDHGGSPWLAARINAAKEHLLGT